MGRGRMDAGETPAVHADDRRGGSVAMDKTTKNTKSTAEAGNPQHKGKPRMSGDERE
jgi:hypothetical protein